ncbi:MAG: hypothetical protein CL398_06200 [Acidiferrobacteraceae bacterium]|nr:hypothetical protein [Acidiferrobacteraceae bacterium]|tara:strand:+ start:927 stop:1370 length:444 start_codon:yes stop_codon:yes gene_type:complete
MSSEEKSGNQPADTRLDVPGQDLSKLIELATAISSAQDAMTDDIVTRLASTIGEGMILMDRLTRNDGLMHLLRALNDPFVQERLDDFATALTDISAENATSTQSSAQIGGYLGLMRVLRDRDVQAAILSLADLLKRANTMRQEKSSS